MLVQFRGYKPLWSVLAGTGLLILAAPFAYGQGKPTGDPRPGECIPALYPSAQAQPLPQSPVGTKQAPTTGQAPTEPPRRPEQALLPPEPSISPGTFGATGGTTVAVAAPGLKGDLFSIPGLAFLAQSHGQPRGAVIVPSARGIKITEDESPAPRDRAYVGFNYYDNLGKAVNERLGVDIHDINVYQETFGVEKTFLDGDASLGLRLPLDTLSADSDSGLGGTHTDVGDLTIVGKYAFWRDRQSGDLLSAGLAITAPTGPDRFANSSIRLIHSTLLQPFVGYIWNLDKWFMQGFTAVQVPTDSNDVTELYNDIAIGYRLYHSEASDRWITGIVPTFEVHVNTPLSHRGAFRDSDPAGTPDIVDLTFASTFHLQERASLAVGFVTSVTGPKPFDFEVLVQFNWLFGARDHKSCCAAISCSACN
jgi:hypothetical protein